MAVIVGIGLVAAIGGILAMVKRRREDKRSRELLPSLNALSNRITAIYATEPERTLNECKESLKVTLVELWHRERCVNICPKCGDTLKVRIVGYYGKILGCPNYPKCRFLIKASELKFGDIDSVSLK
ncbi:MAG: topoisomerase DNA-binding C4 zinc finger domain-containing protein [Verrucomicrobia bacterium]|nr:topoisomerase DNA-binding C4 zinc finger domain-containing protein [Verrucomicrobiota bacterium]